MKGFLLTASIVLFSAAALADAAVLLYHRVGDGRYPTTNVSTEAFREEMRWLKEKGYTVISTRKLEDYLLRGAEIPEKSVVLHFDDGLRSVYTNGLPILREFNYPFTVFVTTDPIEKGYRDYLTWDMLREMAALGAEIAVHGHSHEKLGFAPGGVSGQTFAAAIDHEIEESRKSLRARGFDFPWYAYAFGEYGPELIKASKEKGFSLGFVQDPGTVGRGTDPFLIPRYAVVGSVADSDIFRERLTYKSLPLADRTPEYGKLEGGEIKRISARIRNPELYVPGTVNVFVSEFGRVPATFDPATGAVSAVLGKKPGNKLNRIIVTIKEKASGRYALGSWAVLRE